MLTTAVDNAIPCTPMNRIKRKLNTILRVKLNTPAHIKIVFILKAENSRIISAAGIQKGNCSKYKRCICATTIESSDKNAPRSNNNFTIKGEAIINKMTTGMEIAKMNLQ